MDCQEFLRLAGPQLDGELDRDLSRQLDEHAKRCASCRLERSRLLALDRALDRALEASPFGDAFAARVARRAEATPRSAGGPRGIPRVRPRVATLAMAAAGFVLVLAIWRPWESGERALPERTAPVPPPLAVGGAPTQVLPPGEGRRSIDLEDGSRVQLAEGALFEPRQTERGFEGWLEAGWVRARVRPQTAGRTFAIRTPRALAVAIGTEFDIGYDPDREVTSLFVIEGEVRFVPLQEGSGALTFTAGKGASIGPARPSPSGPAADPRPVQGPPPLDRPHGIDGGRGEPAGGVPADLPRRP